MKGNSVRIRITKPELEYFDREKYLEESVNFGSNKLVYALSSLEKPEVLSVNYENNKITLHLPPAVADEWANTERVGVESEIELSDGKKLYILLEKDFKCLDNTMEDQSDSFPNPLAQNKG